MKTIVQHGTAVEDRDTGPHAGNRKIAEPPPPTERGPVSWCSRRRYEEQKRRQQLVGSAVRVTRVMKTKGASKD